MRKVVGLCAVVTQMKYVRVENVTARVLCLEINTWRIFVFFWGKHAGGNKNRACKEDLRHYTGRERGVEAIFFISHVEIPYRRTWKKLQVCVDARLGYARVCGNPYRWESTRKLCLIFARWYHAVQSVPIYVHGVLKLSTILFSIDTKMIPFYINGNVEILIHYFQTLIVTLPL